MTDQQSSRNTAEDAFLLLLIVVATLAFGWLIGPFIGAILWSVIAAILFAPLNTRLLKAMPNHRNLSALVTLSVIVAVAVVPAMLLAAALLDQSASTYILALAVNLPPKSIHFIINGR
jgi:predicted PurR-regulated permease PerM